jgi:integrase/recombinase XerD
VTIDSYLAYLRDVRRMSPNTIESYARDLAGLAAFAEKLGRDVGALDRRDLESYVRSLMASGLSPRSTARAVACVRGFYRFAAVEQQQEGSPADDLQAPRAWAALPKFLDLEEVDRLLAQPDVATPRGLRDKALISVLYATGLRVTELISLKQSNLHLQDGYLTCVGKGDKERIVPTGCSAISPKRGLDLPLPVHRGCSSTPAGRHCRASASGNCSRNTGARQASRATSARMCCGIPSRLTCSTAAPTCAPSR